MNKISIARNFRKTRKSFLVKSKELKKISFKCYRAYIYQCIIIGKDEFEIKFDGKYVTTIRQRIIDYIYYFFKCIYRFFIIHFTSQNDNTLGKYSLIHGGVYEPIHVKITNIPNEYLLENI